jgi:plastocyanin
MTPHAVLHPRLSRLVAPGLLVLAGLLIASGVLVGAPGGARAATVPAATTEFVNISATGALSFVPDSFSVLPGAPVHLVVTQMADFDHTFTMSPAVNVTIPSSDTSAQLHAFFNAHPPIVNLSLGSTVGHESFANFTAPTTLGAYEWVCLIHFPTMFGIMTVANSPPSSGNGSSPPTVELVAVGAVVGIVVVVGVLLAWGRSRRRARARGGSPPAQ